MDCNREEALRAKQMAEKKMENKDFSGALKIAVKAQKLYPELENISQMILVCEVHCSAEKRSFGSDKDWYGILKIETTADDLAIKKQYRKLALVLHPDKNKFSGSADAFKLIGEAQRVLLDRDKRMMHDSKRRAFGNVSTPSWIPKQPSRQSNVHQHPWNQSNFAQGHSVSENNFTGGRSANFQFSQQRGQTGNRSTFWTVCPFCSVRYQFYRDDVLNKVIHCQSCKKSFTAYELNVQGAAQSHQVPVFPQQNKAPSKGTDGTHNSNFTSKPVFGGQEKEPSKAHGNVNRKRKKKVEESSSESSDDESSSESEEEDVEEHSDSSENESSTVLENKFVPKNVDKNPANEDFGEQPRRSSRPKRNVSYKENLNENDDDATHSNQAKKDPSVEDTFWKAEVTKVVKETQQNNEESYSKPNLVDKLSDNEEEREPEVYECPDPEFSDFEKERKEESFAAGQIWAVYDNDDAMPRFYAYIRRVVSSPEFNLQITWLKAVPGNTDEKGWVEEELPVSCGRFKRGKNDMAEDLPMFSHLVTWEDAKKGMFNIFPRKGETWALFRNWSIKWSCDGTRIYEYEFVEILSDYADDLGVRVSYLEKVKGFTCLFNAKEDGGLLIPASDKYRFSHMVPSCRMSGVEREGVPKGSYELDPASLPASAFEQVTL
ncbi:J domain-containing protein DDB_G0295729-like [Cynara cardunculus var. scolymus]|uniref:DnaJ domain-containing protein n=1 Tax=Cynara cardunculus var. scolymus TaxID=59895 RepID=A0A103XIV0_CYNCS|nr:J domain-containing protein DDB_G0295729-like [Cynara cardunculus var. scolymus]XP_024996141.1 J domain-containing protein DDB_G0295729-like [Cynara cardunculus var. scolymus]XP_024996142.1 J domain-containing protein DDB_G0295729-like [Cynara cardunculus var. scolymus]XP_024996143.1 J domain-containing protein DDB_G0295729-like [Cynara cardunculus var. scolymus]XP_024996144.1 J domain-containing protein DDB_G0295729-like [Cynara cardunculus var. scolymus]XP_024996145.1 J domain-containing 